MFTRLSLLWKCPWPATIEYIHVHVARSIPLTSQFSCDGPLYKVITYSIRVNISRSGHLSGIYILQGRNSRMVRFKIKFKAAGPMKPLYAFHTAGPDRAGLLLGPLQTGGCHKYMYLKLGVTT